VSKEDDVREMFRLTEERFSRIDVLVNNAAVCDVLRAIIEGLDYQFLDIVTAMESGLGSRLDKFVAVGATRNQFWMQDKADVTGRPVEVPDVEEATPLGQPYWPASASVCTRTSRTPSSTYTDPARRTNPIRTSPPATRSGCRYTGNSTPR